MSKRLPLGPLSKVTGVAMSLTGLTLFAILASFKSDPALLVVGLLCLTAVGLVATGLRWAPGAAALLGGLILVAFFPVLKTVLFDPTDPGYGHVMLAGLTALVSVFAGVAALWQNYRTHEPFAPRWLNATLTGLFTLWLGATFVASLSTTGAAAAIAPEAAREILTVQAKDSRFVQPELRVKAGQIVTVRLENQDAMNHTFDIDELDVHALVPANQTNVAVFKASKPGTYTIYCVPHYNKQTGQGMKATLIIEP